MEGDAYELTVDDVLALHRSWITDLFVTERKTEVEIIELLYHQRFVVRSVSFYLKIMSASTKQPSIAWLSYINVFLTGT